MTIGGQGYLYRGRLINNNQLVAVKKIPLRGMNGRSIPENVVCNLSTHLFIV